MLNNSCPTCGRDDPYPILRKPGVFRCRGCKRDYTATSGTAIHSHKKPLAFYATAEEFFHEHHNKGAVLAFSQIHGCGYKTAWLLFKKLGYRVRSSLASGQVPEAPHAAEITKE